MAAMTKGVYKKLYSGEITCSTTDTNITTIATITVDGAYRTDKLIYCRIRDKAGKRNGYFYGTDNFCSKAATLTGFVYKCDNDATVVNATTSGIYVRALGTDGKITIASRYNSLYTTTIDGTYTIEIYALDWPDDTSPY